MYSSLSTYICLYVRMCIYVDTEFVLYYLICTVCTGYLSYIMCKHTGCDTMFTVMVATISFYHDVVILHYPTTVLKTLHVVHWKFPGYSYCIECSL